MSSARVHLRPGAATSLERQWGSESGCVCIAKNAKWCPGCPPAPTRTHADGDARTGWRPTAIPVYREHRGTTPIELYLGSVQRR